MLTFLFAFLTIVTGIVTAGYAGSDNDLGFGGDSYGYGFSGSYSGSGPSPNFAIPAFDFSGFLGNYVDSLSRYHQDFISKGGGAFSYSYASSSPSASAKAQSSLTFRTNNGIQRNVQNYGQPGGFSGGYGGSFGGGSDGAFGSSFSRPESYSFSSPSAGSRSYPERINFASRNSFGAPASGVASSSASIGPKGIQQSASIYPENPNSPNVNTGFVPAPAGPAGFRSVFTSSESRTTNVGGKPITMQRASTTVNDNGKVVTYTAKSQ